MTKPDSHLRQYPLIDVVPVSLQLQNVLLLGKEPIWPDVKRSYCICRGESKRGMLGCEGCDEWYHPACLKLKGKDVEEVKGNKDWRCGFCNADVNNEGKRVWNAPVSEAQRKSRKVQLERANGDSPRAQGIDLDAPESLPPQLPSWDEIGKKVRETGQRYRAEQKKLKAKARRAVARGGHHVVDERGIGGVQPRVADGALIDELQHAGLLSDGEEEEEDVSDVSADE